MARTAASLSNAMIDVYLSPAQTQARDAALRHLARTRAAERLWQRDASLWYPAPETQRRIRQRLGWLDLPDPDEIERSLAELRAAVERAQAQQIMFVVAGVLARAVHLWLACVPPPPTPSISVIDTADPVLIGAVLAQRRRVRTLVVQLGPVDTPQAVAMAAILPADHTLSLPPDTGERFAALTAAALAPAALAGLPWRALLDHVHRLQGELRRQDVADNPGFLLGTTLSTLAQTGHDLLQITASSSLTPLARWLEALIAGALSKHRRGFVPLGHVPPIAARASDSVHVELDRDRVPVDRVGSDMPVVRCVAGSTEAIAEQVLRWQLAVAVMAMVIGVNPFDAPDADVINARIATQLDRHPNLPLSHDEDVPSLLGHARFIAIAAYVSPVHDAALRALQQHLATTFDRPVLLIYPVRDAAFSLQLLHAGRPGGCVVALSDQRRSPESADLLPLAHLRQAHLAVECETWRRMKQPFVHIDLGADVAAGVARVMSRFADRR